MKLSHIMLLVTLIFGVTPAYSQNVSKLEVVTDTKSAPYDCILFQYVTRRKMLFEVDKRSTGFLIRPNVVLTAAHNMHSNGLTNVIKIKLYPGRYKNTYAHDSIQIDGRKNVMVHPKYRFSDENRIRYDFATVMIPDSLIPVDWPKKACFELDSNYVLKPGDTIYVAGYPADGGYDGSLLTTQHQQVKVINDRDFKHDFDTEGGNSGSPIWVEKDGRRIIVGVHTFPNGATLLNREYVVMIMKWINTR